MALVNHKKIQEGMILHIREVLDGLLSEMPSEIGSLPSVIKSHTKSIRPDFPYIIVEKLTSLRGAGDNAWLRTEYLDEETKELRYRHEHRVGLSITCYGEDSDNILNMLRVSIVDDRLRAKVNKQTDAVFLQYSDIGEKPMFIETDFIEGSEMDVFFTAISDWAPLGRGVAVIESVEVSGNYRISDLTTEITVSNKITI
jgi:hypothetical protein